MATITKEAPKELEKPVEKTVTPEEERYKTVLHGWGRVAPTEKHFISNEGGTILFEGGIARNVPAEVAEEMRISRKVKVHVLPQDANEGDFSKVTGIQPMPVSKFAAMLGAYDPAAIRAALGEDKVAELVKALQAK